MNGKLLLSRIQGSAILLLLLLGGAGCAVTMVEPPPLVVEASASGNSRIVHYPPQYVAHDSESFWDLHQLKDNAVGLLEMDVVWLADLGLDSLTPGPERRPVEHQIEALKNGYARLPDCAVVRVVGDLFAALGIEKTSLGRRDWWFLPRLVYLTDWGQNTLGELNTSAGHCVFLSGPLIPPAATAPANKGVDWLQSRSLGLYSYVLVKLNHGTDSAISGGESAWGNVVGIFLPRRSKADAGLRQETGKLAGTGNP